MYPGSTVLGRKSDVTLVYLSVSSERQRKEPKKPTQMHPDFADSVDLLSKRHFGNSPAAFNP